jgi:hypothetical protein
LEGLLGLGCVRDEQLSDCHGSVHLAAVDPVLVDERLVDEVGALLLVRQERASDGGDRSQELRADREDVDDRVTLLVADAFDPVGFESLVLASVGAPVGQVDAEQG